MASSEDLLKRAALHVLLKILSCSVVFFFVMMCLAEKPLLAEMHTQ